MALTQGRWCTFKCLWLVKANKCPVLSLTLQPFYDFTAVSVHTVSEIFPWGDRRALPESLENVSQEINSEMSEELSVRKDTLVIGTFSSIFCATPPLCTPKMSNTFPQLKDYLVSLHHFTLQDKFTDINSTQRSCGSWPILHPLRHETNVPMLKIRCLNELKSGIDVFIYAIPSDCLRRICDSNCNSAPRMLSVMAE